MKIDALWREMEDEAARLERPRWITRFALPRPGRVLLVALEPETSARALLLPIPESEIPDKRERHESDGLEIFVLKIAGEMHLGARLRDRAFADVFTVLAEDIANQVLSAADSRSAARAMLVRIRRWRKFLAAASSGLSRDRIRGLVGELLFLRNHLLPDLGAVGAVESWRAPNRSHQDFQAHGGAIEVKTTTAKAPQVVRIASERQLDSSGLRFLFLHVLILDEHPTASGESRAGESLNDVVARLREGLRESSEASECFEERLLNAGYLETDCHRYSGESYSLRLEKSFSISEGFPCLLEESLPTGIGDVSYSLALAACEPFGVPTASIVRLLAGADPGAANTSREGEPDA